MKKVEKEKEKKEPKKKTAPAAKKAAVKPKKEAAGSAPRKKAKPVKAAETEAQIVAEEPKKTEHKIEHHVVEVKKEKKKPPKSVKFHGAGARKTAIARVWLSSGTGNYLINGRQMEQYASQRRILCNMALQPFVVTNTVGKYNVTANVLGGGCASQIGAVRHAVSKAMLEVNPEYRSALKKAGLLTRDPREKERKKYGQKRARKRFQFSKR